MQFLSHVPTLTHQVAGTFRRLLNIVGAILYFGTPISTTNAVGIGLALTGFAWYTTSKKRRGMKVRRKRSSDFGHDPELGLAREISNPSDILGATSAYDGLDTHSTLSTRASASAVSTAATAGDNRTFSETQTSVLGNFAAQQLFQDMPWRKQKV